MPFLALLTGPAGKLLGYAAAAFAVIIALGWIVHEHDAKVLAQHRAAEQAAQIQQMQVDHARTVAALETAAQAAAARAVASANIRSQVHASPSTSACAGSPAVRAVIDGLRGNAGRGAGAAGTAAGKPVVLPAAAGVAAVRR